jgi:hypothetical protein
MTIQELGSIGELVAAIAVLVSLFYVAYQVRQNTAELRLASLRAVISSYSNFRQSVVSSNELPELIDIARVDPESLSEAQIYRYGYFVEESVWCAQQLFIEILAGQVPDTSWPYAKKRLLQHLNNAVGRAWWEEWKGMYHEDLVAEIDRGLRQADAC